MSATIPHVLILGGGFGGLSAANEIRKSLSSSQVKITIVDKKNWFMVGFAKLWIIKGTRTFENSTGSLSELSKKDIDFLNEEILQIDLENKNIKTTTNNLSYDFLIVAMGAALAPQKIQGLTENGMNLYDYKQSEEIHNKIKELKSGTIAISIMGMPYKCPPAPFEASLIFANSHTNTSEFLLMSRPLSLKNPIRAPRGAKLPGDEKYLERTGNLSMVEWLHRLTPSRRCSTVIGS